MWRARTRLGACEYEDVQRPCGVEHVFLTAVAVADLALVLRNAFFLEGVANHPTVTRRDGQTLPHRSTSTTNAVPLTRVVTRSEAHANAHTYVQPVTCDSAHAHTH
eukprot:6204297-Pleurochrysis_carterae.AAC.9